MAKKAKKVVALDPVKVAAEEDRLLRAFRMLREAGSIIKEVEAGEENQRLLKAQRDKKIAVDKLEALIGEYDDDQDDDWF